MRGNLDNRAYCAGKQSLHSDAVTLYCRQERQETPTGVGLHGVTARDADSGDDVTTR